MTERQNKTGLRREAATPFKTPTGHIQNEPRGNRDSIPEMIFSGTANSRELRTIRALMRAPRMREDLDRIAGASNAPDLVFRLRAAGLEIPCDRVERLDRDGQVCRPGRYSLTADDRKRIRDWLRRTRSRL